MSLTCLSFSRRGSAYRARIATLTLLAVLALLPTVGAPAAPARPFVEEVDRLERFPADARAALGADFVPEWKDVESDFTRFSQKNISGTAIAIPEARQLWQFYPHRNRTGVVVRDLDTLRIDEVLLLDDRFERATTTAQGGEWSHAVDPEGRRLFLLGCACPSRADHVYEFDLRTFAVTKRPALGGHLLSALTPAGMSYDRFADDVLLLYGGPSNSGAVNVNTFLYRLDATRGGAPEPFDQTKLYKVRACTAPMGSIEPTGDTYNWEILATPEFLYVPCQRAGHTVIVVRMARPEGGTDLRHVEDLAAGPVGGRRCWPTRRGAGCSRCRSTARRSGPSRRPPCRS